jgi:hypothetical protein
MTHDVYRITRQAESNVFSQFGEDGVIIEIFRRIGESERKACEFGAWDGKYCSNVAALIERGWNAIMIEGNPNKFEELKNNYRENTRVTTSCGFISAIGENSLDSTLSRNGFVGEMDFLSIDVDGDDYWIFSGMQIRPRVICVEFNPTMGPWHQYVNPPGGCHGTAMASFVARGAELGYSLVYATYGNLFFVRSDQLNGLQILTACEAFEGIGEITIIGSFFDGGNVVLGANRNKWTQVRNCRAIVPPRFLRAWPQSRWRILIQHLLYDSPSSLLRRAIRRLGQGR